MRYFRIVRCCNSYALRIYHGRYCAPPAVYWRAGVKSHYSALLATLLLSMQTTQAHAAELVVACPAELPAQALQGVQLPQGWLASTPHRLRLTAVGMMAGAPASKLELKPEASQTSRPQRTVETWDLRGDFPEGKWISCQYGEDAVRLSRRFDDKVTSCSVTTAKNTGLAVIDARCSTAP